MAVELTPGSLRANLQLVQNMALSRGGLSYENHAKRKMEAGVAGIELGTSVRKMDNASVVSAMQKLVKQAFHACRTRCANTEFGWVTIHTSVLDLRADFVRLTEDAHALNDWAAKAGSKQRVRMGFVVARLEIDDVVLRSLEQTLGTIAADLAEALEKRSITGTSNLFRSALIRGQNLEDLLVGNAKDDYLRVLDLARQVKERILATPREATLQIKAEMNALASYIR